jgi:periplasmic protein TonB
MFQNTKTGKNLILVCLYAAIVFSISACGGHDSSSKNDTDSVTAAPNAPKAVDSAAKAGKRMKKKGQLSVSMSSDNNAKIAKDANGIYNRTEVAPEFPGGQSALSDYINNHLTYPQTAIDNGISGTLHVTFVVDEHGKVTGAQAIDGKNLGDALISETLNVFNTMPAWKPGLVHGKKVKSRLQLPVTFQLADAE